MRSVLFHNNNLNCETSLCNISEPVKKSCTLLRVCDRMVCHRQVKVINFLVFFSYGQGSKSFAITNLLYIHVEVFAYLQL